jgi:hypothetical protein
MLTDFEQASINAWKKVFPHCELTACLFHLSQSLFRKIVEIGFKVRYSTDDEFSLKMRCFSALAFLPVQDVTEAFEDLTDDDDIPQEFVTYFETNYIGNLRGRGAQRRRLEPLFPKELWNVHDRVEDDLPRTNNSLEAFHNAFHLSVSNTHPNIWRLIDMLKKEESFSQTKKTHFERGEPGGKKRKYKDMNLLIKNQVERYDPEDKIKFLRSVARNIHIF